MAKRPVVFGCLIATILFHLSPAALAQTNSWTNSASGNWEDAYWSLGVLPGTNQTILFTNDGTKTLTIGANTVQNFPGTLNVNSITISSPLNSFNTLSLNSAGTGSPLTVQSISVGSNSAMTMISSALELNGPSGAGLQVGGEFDQNASVVSGQQVNVGYTGPGIYNLNSGILDVSNLWVGGSFDGVFNQTGGTNNTGIVGLDPGGTYNLSGGDLNATVYFNTLSTFHQTGGRIDQPLAIYNGTYLFDGGINYGGIVDPIDNGQYPDNGRAQVIQTGGTNFGGLTMGSYGIGFYTLSNGCSFISSLNVGATGIFQQFGGIQIVTNLLYLAPDVPDFSERAPAFNSGGIYTLSGGMLMAGSMTVNCQYTQNGGTNLVAGDIEITNPAPIVFGGIQLNGGLLKAQDITLYSGSVLQLLGGSLVANNLTVHGQVPPVMTRFGPDINCGGGELIVSNIDVEGDYFAISGTTIKQSGTLTLGQMSALLPGSGIYNFGPLIPNPGDIDLGTNVNCQIHFADSSSQVWTNGMLRIGNWSGSIYGGGSQQIIFGSNSAALTPDQLKRIIFLGVPAGTPPHSPNGAPSSVYFARILPTGEIVPDTGAPLPMKMTLTCCPTNPAMQLSLGAEIGSSYDIEVSTDMVNWTWWTNELNSNGTIYLNDFDATNYPQKFYRARPAP